MQFPSVVFSPEVDNPVIAAAIREVLIKSRTSVDSLFATLRKRLAGYPFVSDDKDAA